MNDTEEPELSNRQIAVEVQELLRLCKEDLGEGNTLRLNLALQKHLEDIRMRIVKLLKVVKAQYARNEELLKLHSHPPSGIDKIGKGGAVLRGGTFCFKGNLFFRDVNGRSCPNNADYEERCATEMFPTDFDMRSKHIWTMHDKKSVVMGIKQQLLDHAAFDQPKVFSANCKSKAIAQHKRSLASLLAEADTSFVIDWNQISTIDVASRHSPYSCEAIWEAYLHPRLQRDEWTAEEDERLLEMAQTTNLQDWDAIAKSVGNRSDYQCFVRFQTTLRALVQQPSYKRWTKEEDKRLIDAVTKFTINGATDWARVNELFPNKHKTTLLGRYIYELKPNISHDPFTIREDMMLYAAVEEYKGKFYCFPRTLFPNRSLVQLRMRYYNVLTHRDKTDSWSKEDDRKLMDFVSQNGISEWLKCANFLGNHTRTSCRTRFMVIKKYLEKHPNAGIADFPRRCVKKYTEINQNNWQDRIDGWQGNADALDLPAPKRMKTMKVKSSANTYAKSLRNADLQAYEFFKFSFNLRLNKKPAKVVLPVDDSNLCRVTRALQYFPPPSLLNPIKCLNLPLLLQRCYNRMYQDLPLDVCLNNSEPELLPPNWSTLMAFRAFCILTVDCRNQIVTNKCPVTYDEKKPAVQLFRQRLRSLLFRTALLSRLEPKMFGPALDTLKMLPLLHTEVTAKVESNEVEMEVEAPVPTPPRLYCPEEALVAQRQLEALDRLVQSRSRSMKVTAKPKDELPTVKEEIICDE